METFFGEPVPPAVAPFGYWLDYVVAPGGDFWERNWTKIMGKCGKIGRKSWEHDEHVAPWENHRKTVPNCGKIMEIHDEHVAESWANHGKMWQSVIS